LTRTVKVSVAVVELAVNCRIFALSWVLTKKACVLAKFTAYVLLTAASILAANQSYSQPIPAATGSMK
jgi:hypothetical protein